MDYGLLRGVGDAMLLIAFVVFCFWAYSPAQRARFEEDAQLPFRDEPGDVSAEISARRSAR